MQLEVCDFRHSPVLPLTLLDGFGYVSVLCSSALCHIPYCTIDPKQVTITCMISSFRDAGGFAPGPPPKDEITRLSKNVADLTKQLQLQAQIGCMRSDFGINDDVIFSKAQDG